MAAGGSAPPVEAMRGAKGVSVVIVAVVAIVVFGAGVGVGWRVFSALLAAVSVGRMDIAVGAITINGDVGAERNKSMDFSNSYYLSNQGILKRTNDNKAYCAAAVCTVQELNTSTLIIGAQAITTSEFWVEDNLKNVMDAKHLELRPTVEDVLLLLSQGAVDIVVIDLPAAQGIAAKNPSAYAVGGE